MAVLFELLSILVLFPMFSSSRWTRFVWWLQLVSFHWIIRMLLAPDYIPQCICYFVLMSNGYHQQYMYNTKTFLQSDISETTIWCYVVFGNLIICLLILCMIYRVEWFPFSSIPMYSFYRPDDSACYGCLDGDTLKQLVSEKRRFVWPWKNSSTYNWSRSWFKLELCIHRNDRDAQNEIRYNVWKWLDLYAWIKQRKGGRKLVLLARRRLFDVVMEVHEMLMNGQMIVIASSDDDQQQHKAMMNEYEDVDSFVCGLMQLFKANKLIESGTVYELKLGLVQDRKYWNEEMPHNVSSKRFWNQT